MRDERAGLEGGVKIRGGEGGPPGMPDAEPLGPGEGERAAVVLGLVDQGADHVYIVITDLGGVCLL